MNLRGIDASSLPPRESKISAHMKRASFIAHTWANAYQTQIRAQHTNENGWELVDGQYRYIWFEGEQPT